MDMYTYPLLGEFIKLEGQNGSVGLECAVLFLSGICGYT